MSTSSLEKTSKLKVGDPTQKDTFLGPLINESAYKNYQEYVEEARRSAKTTLRRECPAVMGTTQRDTLCSPQLWWIHRRAAVSSNRNCFVPILSVEPYDDLKEAINEMNSVQYGLTGGIFSNDRKEIDEFFARGEAGVLYANRTSGSTTGALVGVHSLSSAGRQVDLAARARAGLTTCSNFCASKARRTTTRKRTPPPIR